MFLDDDGAVVEILQDDFGGAAADLRHRNRDRGKSRRQVFQETAVVPADYRQLLIMNSPGRTATPWPAPSKSSRR